MSEGHDSGISHYYSVGVRFIKDWWKYGLLGYLQIAVVMGIGAWWAMPGLDPVLIVGGALLAPISMNILGMAFMFGLAIANRFVIEAKL